MSRMTLSYGGPFEMVPSLSSTWTRHAWDWNDPKLYARRLSESVKTLNFACNGCSSLQRRKTLYAKRWCVWIFFNPRMATNGTSATEDKLYYQKWDDFNYCSIVMPSIQFVQINGWFFTTRHEATQSSTGQLNISLKESHLGSLQWR